MLTCLVDLPRKMLSLDDVENVTEFVLHDLCHEHCFDLNKAAYFVDNPDFDCLKGVAGFSRDQSYKNCDAIWHETDSFSNHMHSSPFNKKVRNTHRCSVKKSNDSYEQLAQEIANDLGFKHHGVCSWNMKHQNNGLVIYEKESANETFADSYIANGLSLLSFCPIF